MFKYGTTIEHYDHAVPAITAMAALYSSIYIVPQRKVGLITRFGKHIRTDENPGLKFKVPFIDQVAAKVSTAEHQVEEMLQTKTTDDSSTTRIGGR